MRDIERPRCKRCEGKSISLKQGVTVTQCSGRCFHVAETVSTLNSAYKRRNINAYLQATVVKIEGRYVQVPTWRNVDLNQSLLIIFGSGVLGRSMPTLRRISCMTFHGAVCDLGIIQP